MNVVIELLDYFGVVVFAISGALAAARVRMDIVGFALLGVVTGIGGGSLRDILLGQLPVFWVEQPQYIVLCVVVSVVTFLSVPIIASRLRFLLWADAVGLAVFAVLGAQAALAADAPLIIAALLGVVSATFGGIIRDVICGETPLILLKEIYVTAALAGALVYVCLIELSVSSGLAIVIGCTTVFAVRGLALIYGFSLPAFVHRNDREGGSGPTPRESDNY
ncbi:MAG: trimeric intracellular cation channel family protein [Pseudomonadota bacterium]